MSRMLGSVKRWLPLGSVFTGFLAVSVAVAGVFMADRQVPERLLFPVANFSFPVAPGDTIADRVLGQVDFVHATQNFADASTLDFDFARPGAAVAIDQSSVPNHVYVADFRNNRVLGWTSASALTNGEPANIVIGQPDFFSTTCNNGGVSATSLCGPVAVAVDGSGNLYVADNSNNRVLEYNTPFINTGQPGSGDRIADQVFGQEGDFTASLCNLGAGTAATSSTLCGPAGIAIDNTGVLYIADELNNRVLQFLFPSVEVSADDVFGQGGNFSTTTCNKGGVGVNSLCGPVGLAADSFDDLYVADTDNSRVLEYDNPVRLDSTTSDEVFGQGSFTTALCNGGGAAPSALTLCFPTGVALDAAGRLYVADKVNSRVLEYATPSTSTTGNKVFGQGGSMTAAKCNPGGVPNDNALCRPGGLSLDTTGNLYVSDDLNNRVLKYNPAAIDGTTAEVVLGQPDFAHSDPNAVDASAFGGDAADAIAAGSVDIAALGAVAIDNSVSPPRLYVADTHNNRVLGFNNATSFVNGAPADIVIGQQNFFTGTQVCSSNGATSSTLCSPTGVAVDPQGNLYVADQRNNRVLKFLTPVTTGKAAGLVIGQSNFSSNECNAGSTTTAASLCEPWTVAVDANDTLYVADLGNNRALAYFKPTSNHPNAIRVFGQTAFTTSACNQGGLSKFSLCGPTGVAVDAMGRLFVADGNNRVLRYTMPLTLPVADLVFGQGVTGANFTSRTCNIGGIGSATLCSPTGVAIDANFNLYVADALNNRILHYNANLGGVTADMVFGQGGFFTTAKANLGGTAPNATTLSLPLWLAADKAGNLYAADAGNNRVLQYEAPLAVPSPTPTPGLLKLSPTSLNFGDVATGKTSPIKKVALTNTGAGSIIINAVNRVGANPTNFVQNNNCIGSLRGGKSCTISVSFTPSASPGTAEAAQLMIYGNAAEQVLPVSGTSALPVTVTPSTLAFGSVTKGTTSAAKTVTVTNNSSNALTVSPLSLSGTDPGDFLKGTTCGASLAAFGSCTVSVSFKPSATGARSAVLTITDSPDPGSPHKIALTGTGQ